MVSSSDLQSELESAIEGLAQHEQVACLLRLASVNAQRIGTSEDPARYALYVVKSLGMARDLAGSLGVPPGENPYMNSVYGILDCARGQAAQRMNRNSGGLLEGAVFDDERGRAGQRLNCTQEWLLKELLEKGSAATGAGAPDAETRAARLLAGAKDALSALWAYQI